MSAQSITIQQDISSTISYYEPLKINIVTTTINPPTPALLKFAEIVSQRGGKIFIVGDKKTPHSDYADLQKSNSSIVYLDPAYQEDEYSDLSAIIGWNSIQRRNIGFIEAWRDGTAETIATVDDDNYPYDGWGTNVEVNRSRPVEVYDTENLRFEPLSVTNQPHLWHRGFPVEQLPDRNKNQYKGVYDIYSPIQADLWDGDPDIDAMCRIPNKPCVKFDTTKPYTSSAMSPFNSQNTFISRRYLPNYCVFPHIGRMDDIWGAYVFQYLTDTLPVYAPASVYQDRNDHDLVRDLEDEVIGYRNTNNLVNDMANWKAYMPARTLEFWDAYREQYGVPS